VKKSNIINENGWNMAADIRAYAPASKMSLDKQQSISVRSTQYTNYTIGRWTVGATTYIRYFSLRAPEGKTWELYAGPEIGYQITPNVSVGLLYEMLAGHKKATSGLENIGTDLEPSATFQVTPAISLSPYLDIKTGGRISWETTSVNLLMVASIL
jgi:hypothetical protein